jgi:glycine/D-amino acid oxidase-like deaminating enzyme
MVKGNPLPFPVTATLQFESQAELDPLSYLFGLAETFRSEGGQLEEDTPAEDVEDGEPCRVVTSKGVIVARTWSSRRVPCSTTCSCTKLVPYRSYVVVVRPRPPCRTACTGIAHPYHYPRLQPACRLVAAAEPSCGQARGYRPSRSSGLGRGALRGSASTSAGQAILVSIGDLR